LAATLHISAADIVSSVKRAPSEDAFVDVITLRETAHVAVRSIFRTGTELLGHVGTATADIVKVTAGRVRAGDQTGLDGLQRVFDAHLAGTPAVDVYAADADGTPSAPRSLCRATRRS
jgi:penicillin-binding protein